MQNRDVEPPRTVVVPQVVVRVSDSDGGTGGAQLASEAQELPQPKDKTQHPRHQVAGHASSDSLVAQIAHLSRIPLLGKHLGLSCQVAGPVCRPLLMLANDARRLACPRSSLNCVIARIGQAKGRPNHSEVSVEHPALSRSLSLLRKGQPLLDQPCRRAALLHRGHGLPEETGG